MQELCPTRARVQLSIYDFTRTAYRSLPGAFVSAVIANANEGKRLLRLLHAVVERREWQDRARKPSGGTDAAQP
jgi:hypothetical protein